MANKGAIDLVVQKKALEQVDALNAKLLKTEQQIIKISNLARSAQGNFKQVKGNKELNYELKKQSNLLVQIAKNNKKYHDATMEAVNAQNKLRKSLDNTGKTAKRAQSRVMSFFKTLIAFDLARRAVDAFWGSFKKGFEDLKKLDSLRLQFKYLVQDAEEARLTMSFLARVSDELGVNLLSLSESYLAFRKSAELANLSAKDSRQIFEDVTRAASLLGKSDAEIKNVQVALEQMLSKGTVQAEELKKQLGNVLPGSFEIMAKAVDELNPKMEIGNKEFNKMLKAGKIIAADVLPEFARQLKEAYGIENVSRIETMQAETVRLDNAFTNMVRNMEEGTGTLSKTVLFFTAALTDLITHFGELFLSAEQLAKYSEEFAFEKGFKQGSEQIDTMMEKYDGAVDKVKKYAKELADEDGWGLVTARNELEDMKKLLDKDPIVLFAQDGMTIDQVKKRIKSLGKTIGNTEGFIKGMEDAIRKLEEDDSDKKAESRAKAYRLEGEQARGLIQELERLKKIYETMQKTSKDPVEALGFADSIKVAKGFIDILEGVDVAGKVTEDEMKKWTKGIAESLKKLGHTLDLSGDNLKLYMQALDDINHLEMDKMYASMDLASSVVDSVLEMRLNAIDEEMDALQERYDLQKELIEAEVGDEEAKQERLKQLEKEKKIREKKLQKEKEKAEKRAFLLQQAITAATIVMETAKGVSMATATYGSNPYTATLLPAIIGLIIGTGAVQLAAVLAQSIPKFKDGHLAGTHEGPATINDGGIMEVVERKSGSIEMYSAKDAMIHMQKGDKVHKSLDSYLDNGGMMGHLIQAAGFSGVGGFSQTRSEALGLKEEIRDGFKNVKITNDNTNVAKIVADAISDSRYENDFL